MSSISPQVHLMWSVMGILLGSFYASHLWAFDRFRCLRWNQGSQGAFKRIMTYSYMLAVPSLLAYTLGFTVIKYEEGTAFVEGFGAIPKPYEMWTDAHRRAVLPLFICLSAAISFEVITHLEETCFWLYVVSAGPAQVGWFQSAYFKLWVVGSLTAIVYAPLTTVFTRQDPYWCESATFVAFAAGSGLVTLSFLPVLYSFPGFLESLEKEGVNIETIVRLTKFHELNKIRVFFRVMFVVPIAILAVDGLTAQRVARSVFATDMLTIVPAISLIISSGLTLSIFFPRSMESELVRKAPQQQQQTSLALFSQAPNWEPIPSKHPQTDAGSLRGPYDPEVSPVDAPSLNDSIRDSPAGRGWWGREQPSDMRPLAPKRKNLLAPDYTQTEPAIGVASFVEIKVEPRECEHVRGGSAPNVVQRSAGGMSHFVHGLRSPIDFRESM